jgi:cytochrome c oxidase subunit 1
MAETVAAGALDLPGGAKEGGDDYLNAKRGVLSWLFTVDHKRIGVMYLVSTLSAFAIGGVLAMLIRLELIAPGRTLMNAETYNRVFTMHGVIMIFLFIIPAIPAALGNFLVPLMIGAKDVAFPKLNLLSLYLYWMGALIALTSLTGGALDTGWTFYTPYSSSASTTSVVAVTLGAFVMGFSSILTGVNFIVTIHKLRAPGVSWFRMPLFLWSIYATSIVQILATPVLGITLMLLIAERVMGLGIFDPKLGGDPVLYQHFFWFYSHPAVYIMILPGMGIISELIAVHARRKIFGYKAIAFSSVAIALLGFLVWGHHMFVAGQSQLAATLFSFLTFFVAIPSGVKIFNWLGTLWRGSISLSVPMLYALGFLFLFTIGGLTGLFLGMLAVDVHLTDTYFVVAHFHYVMMGGTLMAFIGGLHHWWPKITGRMYSERLGRIGWALVFLGFNATFFVQFILGSRGMPRRYYDYLPRYHFLHALSTVGSWILAAGFVVVLYYLLLSLRDGARAPRNPWGGASMEWQTSSPPTTENFEGRPVAAFGPYDFKPALEAEAARVRAGGEP